MFCMKPRSEEKNVYQNTFDYFICLARGREQKFSSCFFFFNSYSDILFRILQVETYKYYFLSFRITTLGIKDKSKHCISETTGK